MPGPNPNARIGGAFGRTDPGAVRGAGHFTDPYGMRIERMPTGQDMPSYGPAGGRRGGGLTVQRWSQEDPYGQVRVRQGPYSVAEQEALAREFERLHRGNVDDLTPNRRVNRAFVDAAQAPRLRYPQDPRAVRGMKRYQLDELSPAFLRQLQRNPQMRRNLRATGAMGMAPLPNRFQGRPRPPPYPGMGDPLVAQMRAQDLRDPVNQMRLYQAKVDSGLWSPDQAAAFVDRRMGLGPSVGPPAGSIGGAMGYGGYHSGTGSPSLNR